MAFRFRDQDPQSAFQRRLGYRFRRRELLMQALTHRSFAHEAGLEQNYERLEFLGDAVLGLLAAEWLFDSFPELDEGRMSELKSWVVSRPSLSRMAATLGLGEVLRLGAGEERSGGRRKVSLLADALEAVLGAIFVDRGIKAARKVAFPLFEEALEQRAELGFTDAKTRLQEYAQARSWSLPDYRHVSAEGPDHRKEFTVECWVEGRRAGQGKGPSKKAAERRAAAAALERLTRP